MKKIFDCRNPSFRRGGLRDVTVTPAGVWVHKSQSVFSQRRVKGSEKSAGGIVSFSRNPSFRRGGLRDDEMSESKIEGEKVAIRLFAEEG